VAAREAIAHTPHPSIHFVKVFAHFSATWERGLILKGYSNNFSCRAMKIPKFPQHPCGEIGSPDTTNLPMFRVVQSTKATIIRLTRLTDSSLIVHWFSEEHGLLKTVAKGARRPKSSFAGQLDLFFAGEITFRRARRGELHALREVSIRQWREGLRRNYRTTLFASYCCQLLESAVEPEHPEPGLHDLLTRALNHADKVEPDMRSLRHYERELARLLGISHDARQAHLTLGDALGGLPNSREDLVERLCPSDDLDSSAERNTR
jgi:DNA repair protein RecO (recombination protein O)